MRARVVYKRARERRNCWKRNVLYVDTLAPQVVSQWRPTLTCGCTYCRRPHKLNNNANMCTAAVSDLDVLYEYFSAILKLEESLSFTSENDYLFAPLKN